MLSEECYGCFSPLVEKGKEKICVGCGDGWKKYLKTEKKAYMKSENEDDLETRI